MPRRRSNLDPLLSALIDKLPKAEAGFAPGAREDWLDMMRKAFDVTYGRAGNGNSEEPMFAVAAPQLPAAVATFDAGGDYYIDKDGFARRDAPEQPRILPDEVGPGDIIYDHRTGSARGGDTIVWADDSLGAGPGMNFCGPG